MATLISHGSIVDGTGRAPYQADVLIERDVIAKIAPDIPAQGVQRVIDARGMTVTPGLIDAHTHAEISLMQNRQSPAAVYQGIATVVTGQCGLGFAPMAPGAMDESLRMNSGIFGMLPDYCKRWSRFDEYLSLLEGCAVNVGANVSHNAIRQFSCGFDHVPLTGARLDRSLGALDEALSAGAVGFSVGLSYYPGGYSDTEELIQLCRVVKKHDAVFCVHMRLDVDHPDFRPMEEIARVIEATGVRTNMLHHRTGGMEDYNTCMAPFEKVIAKGAEVTFEFYPYMVGSGLLLAVVPDWAQEGGATAIMERLTSPAQKSRLMKDLKHRFSFFFGPGTTGRIYWTKDPYSDARGRTLRGVAELRGVSDEEAAVQLLVENDLEVGFNGVEYQSEELKAKLYDDQYHLFLNPRYTVGSDSIPTGGLSHCRTSGAFARIIRQMRDRGVPAETIIRKLSGRPAEIYGLRDRGTLTVGKKADVCVMDFGRVTDGADESFTRRKPEGIRTLLVNGLPVMLDGTITGELSGRALRR